MGIMNTKISRFKHVSNTGQVKLTPIDIKKYLNSGGVVDNTIDNGEVHVTDWDNAVLVCKRTNNGVYDTIMLYDDCMVDDDGTITRGVICFGKWNDGVTII